MRGKDAFDVEGIVIEALPNGTYRAELANGHRLIAFATGRAKAAMRFAPGDKLSLRLTPFDLSTGRILVERSN
jgi:translation initiation factor IF-1